MKKIGIIGGLGPESTLDYYKGIIAAFHSTYDQTGYPEIAIESCNLKEMLSYSNQDQWDILAEILAQKCNLLYNAGCDFGAIASNTPHKVFDEIQTATRLPLISIVDTACNFALKHDLKNLCLLGTGFTMRSDYYQKIFNTNQIDLFVPDTDEIEYIHQKIFSELEFGIVEQDTKNKLIAILDRIVLKNNCQGAIMGCTELPLILKVEDISVFYLDPTATHIQKIVELCKSE